MIWPTIIVIFCVLLITGVTLYAPVVYIRKTNKLLKVLEEIAANTRK